MIKHFMIIRKPNLCIISGKTEVVAMKKEKRQRDPAIQDGLPLPANGTCQHYKKSFRWLR